MHVEKQDQIYDLTKKLIWVLLKSVTNCNYVQL